MNKLYFGDCLEILIKLSSEHSEGFIDLIYIDPPFNSKRDYNILFEAADIKDTKAQKEAFADTWSNVSYKDTLQQIKEVDLDLWSFLEALDKIRISKGAVSYLTIMAIRIWYIHKVLKSAGTFYLHCDPTMSHYLKLVCDLIFKQKNFRNEIAWCYRGAGYPKKDFGKRHDIILRYTKSDNYTFDLDAVREPYAETTKKRFEHYIGNVRDGVDYGQQELHKLGRHPDDWWQIQPIAPSANDRLGYPTQKPDALLEKIIAASSRKGDLVADFFCGCGTTIAAAQKLHRNWIGVDISHLAIGLIERKRLIEPFKGATEKLKPKYEVFGFPKDIGSAKQLAEQTAHGRFKFQDWIIEAKLGGVHNPKKTADGGWDGHLTFEIPNDKREHVLIEVKSGNVNVKNVREFIHVVNNNNAGIGVFVCFAEQVTKPMLLEAKNQGYYNYGSNASHYDKIQIITVEDLLNGETVKIPYSKGQTFKTAQRKLSNGDTQQILELE